MAPRHEFWRQCQEKDRDAGNEMFANKYRSYMEWETAELGRCVGSGSLLDVTG